MLEISENQTNGTLFFRVRVQPRASKDEISGEMAGALKGRLRAPAVEEPANEALVQFLVQILKNPQSAVRIFCGIERRTNRSGNCGVQPEQTLRLDQQGD